MPRRAAPRRALAPQPRRWRCPTTAARGGAAASAAILWAPPPSPVWGRTFPWVPHRPPAPATSIPPGQRSGPGRTVGTRGMRAPHAPLPPRAPRARTSCRRRSCHHRRRSRPAAGRGTHRHPQPSRVRLVGGHAHPTWCGVAGGGTARRVGFAPSGDGVLRVCTSATLLHRGWGGPPPRRSRGHAARLAPVRRGRLRRSRLRPAAAGASCGGPTRANMLWASLPSAFKSPQAHHQPRWYRQRCTSRSVSHGSVEAHGYKEIEKWRTFKKKKEKNVHAHNSQPQASSNGACNDLGHLEVLTAHHHVQSNPVRLHRHLCTKQDLVLRRKNARHK